MDIIQSNLSIAMIRGNLMNIPQFDLPDGISMRWYEEGDAGLWVEIQSQAEQRLTISNDLYVKEFGTDPSLLEHRQCFLLNKDGRGIGTGTAWFNHNYNGAYYGRIHWVAIIPEMQGKGLSKALLTIVCNRLHSLGHARAYLTTSTERVAAIRLYHQFGFVPEIRNARDRAIWAELEEKLQRDFRV